MADRIGKAFGWCFGAALAAGSVRAQESALGLGLDEVPFEAVELQDGFWKERARQIAQHALPGLFDAAAERGLVRNFELVAGGGEGEHSGDPRDDALLYELLEAAAYSLASFPDAALAARVDAIVAKIAAAQREDGYVGTYLALAGEGKPYHDPAEGRELFCAARLIEAGIALAQVAQKPELLAVARRAADGIVANFDAQPKGGRPREISPPGFPEIEYALVRLSRHTKEHRYEACAEALVDARGRRLQRKLYGEYALDQLPLLETKAASGHAARAMNLYAGVAELARRTAYDDLYTNALTLFDDASRHKTSLVGGVGLASRRDAFALADEMPLDDAGSELEACCGFARWSEELFLLTGHGVHASAMERALANAVLASPAFDGPAFLARAPLASDGSVERLPGLQSGFAATEVCRALLSMPGRIYARDAKGLYVSTYAPSRTTVPAGDGEMRVSIETRFPWDGHVAIRFDGEWARKLALHVLIPAWCTEGVTLGVNEPIRTITVDHGHDPGTFLVFEREWQPGDAFLLELPLVAKRVHAAPEVESLRGRVALRRGPFVYAFEACDHEGELENLFLPPDAALTTEWRSDVAGGVEVIHAEGRALRRGPKGVLPEPVQLTAVPYYAFGRRERGSMRVWIPESAKLCTPPPR